MKNKIILDLNHHDKTRAEYFLNSVDATLEQIPFDVKGLHHAGDSISGFKFKEKDQSTFVTVIFATSYFHANEIATANSLYKAPNTRCTINGDLLFIVESSDEESIANMLSLFAGRE
jgi:hypothetical protein